MGFVVIWDGPEPSLEQYNETYIEELRDIIKLAHKYNQYIGYASRFILFVIW